MHMASVGDRSVLVVALPGVPSELKAIVQDHVVPRLKDKVTVAPSAQRTLLTAGIRESDLQDAIDATAFLSQDHFSLAYLPSSKGVRLRITAQGSTRQEARTRLEQFEDHIRAQVGAHVYGTGTESLEAIIGELLRADGLTLAVAESCTGGLLADRLTNVPGASDYLRGGIVAYCNQMKQDLLGVPEAMLEEHGAVSSAVARQMAVGVRERLDADIGLSTTGIAGPKGGTPEKPVGTVWIGIATPETTAAHHFVFTSDRLFNKDRTCTEALNILRSEHKAAAEPTVGVPLAAETDTPE
ncbi:MAG: nicotinamide-nucleotide amidohydrolase family protein, partial [Bacteroidetes bacterium]|jgi:nicotinamide-nucleotide amidase|nr:nicotinamide-nucleotide amidohydrolase family protein [Bacteroidota bacterium]